jgi:transcriptional regulator GlxA family with amidase domain
MSKVAILLTQGFADWESALIGGTGGPFYGLDIRYFTPAVGDVRSQGGLTAIVSQNLDDLSKWQPNAVVVVGGTIWETDEAPDIYNVLKAQHAGGAVIAGICGGTLALARAGLLDDVRHTSNDPAFLSQNADGYSGADLYFGSASAISENRVITAPGTAPASFTAAIFESVGLDHEKVAQFKAMMAAEHV